MTAKLKEVFDCLEKNQITEPINFKVSSKIENFNNEKIEYNEYLKCIDKKYKILSSKPLHEKMENNTIETTFKIQCVEENFGIEIF